MADLLPLEAACAMASKHCQHRCLTWVGESQGVHGAALGGLTQLAGTSSQGCCTSVSANVVGSQHRADALRWEFRKHKLYLFQRMGTLAGIQPILTEEKWWAVS